jgi:hypothetical protein
VDGGDRGAHGRRPPDRALQAAALPPRRAPIAASRGRRPPS